MRPAASPATAGVDLGQRARLHGRALAVDGADVVGVDPERPVVARDGLVVLLSGQRRVRSGDEPVELLGRLRRLGAPRGVRHFLGRRLLGLLDAREDLGRLVVPGGEVTAGVGLLLRLVEILGAQGVLRGPEVQLGLLPAERILDDALRAGVALILGQGAARLAHGLVVVAAVEGGLGRPHELALGFDGRHRGRRRRLRGRRERGHGHRGGNGAVRRRSRDRGRRRPRLGLLPVDEPARHDEEHGHPAQDDIQHGMALRGWRRGLVLRARRGRRTRPGRPCGRPSLARDLTGRQDGLRGAAPHGPRLLDRGRGLAGCGGAEVHRRPDLRLVARDQGRPRGRLRQRLRRRSRRLLEVE